MNDEEQEYPVANNVQVTEDGAPSDWTMLHAN
ncbi:UNVERIFIED_CONTAM: hypothetical protein ABID98_001876 [Brevibacillus sp. OAP136]